LKSLINKIELKLNFNKNITKELRENPSILNLYNEVEKFLIKELFVDKTYKVVVAVSGGVDSTVLLDLLYQVSTKYGFELYIAHFNHKLRGEESDQDELFVESLAKHYGLEFYHSSGKVKEYSNKNAMSIEAAARQLRYNFFEKTTRTIKADFIATAHTSDDNIETFFINLIRGSGLTGLSGIPRVRQLIKNVRIIRPLLSFSKKDLINYAKIRKLVWREDESNNWLEYTRNKVRHKLIPFLENEFNNSITSNIARVTTFLQGADEFISKFIEDYYLNLIEIPEENKVMLHIPKLNTYNVYLQGEIISHLLKKNFEINQVNFIQIDRIIALKNAETGSIVEINKFITCYKDRNYLLFTRNKIPLKVNKVVEKISTTVFNDFTIKLEVVKPNQVKFTDDGNIEYLDYDKLPITLTIRNWEEGDTFQPLGMEGTKKISDFLIDKKISNFDKNFIYVLSTHTDVVWVIGLQINDKYKLTKETKRIIKATIIKD
jgi:tRNA(Ile)-lysidine synthase